MKSESQSRSDEQIVKGVRRWLDSKEAMIDNKDIRRVCYLAERWLEHAALRKRIDTHLSGSVASEIRAPQGHDQAMARIEECVREIEMIADTFGYDPCEWLAGEDQGK